MTKLKTNMLMEVFIDSGTVKAEHKTGMVCVNDLVLAGNQVRILNGKPHMTVQQLLKYQSLKDFVNAIQTEIEDGHYDYYEIIGNLIQVKSRGKSKGTYAFLPIALKIASLMSPEFEAVIYRVFIEGQLLKLRDDGGNNFKKLNRAIDLYLPKREEKNGNRGCYINAAKLLRKKIFPERNQWDDTNIWNTDEASGQHHDLRKKYEDRLCAFLKMGFIKDWEHLKEIINKLD
jgi:hypothetical protein